MSRLFALLWLVLGAMAPCLATTYKWVDAQGQVHFSDTPPAGVRYEVIEAPPAPPMPPAPPPPPPDTPSLSTAPPTALPSAPRAAMPPDAAPRVAESRKTAATKAAEQDLVCVEALYQVVLLRESGRVYKPQTTGQRRYLSDRERPAEVERFARLRDEACSADPVIRAEQERRAADMRRGLSPACFEAREKLALISKPEARTPDLDVEKQRVFVLRYCPQVVVGDVWLADWILVP